jgi:exocyst complex component 4
MPVLAVHDQLALSVGRVTCCACFALLAQLREQRAVVEDLVDGVVEGYHAGFNKAIHNYSQILRLFSESKAQVRGGGDVWDPFFYRLP